MAVRLLLDEHIEHEVLHRLEDAGHDVEHVTLSPSIDAGDSDATLAHYSREHSRIIVTYDDDFVDLSPDDYYCVLLFENDDLSTTQVATVVQRMAATFPESEFGGMNKVGKEWL